MNASNEGQSFDIRLTSDMLRRDAQNAANQFNRLQQQAVRSGKQIDAQFNSMGHNLSSSINKGVEGAKSALADLGKNILGISALLASGSFIKDIYSAVGEFNKQMRIVSTISEDVTNNMDKYKEQVLSLCTELAVAPEIAAQALYQINSAGHLGQDGMKVLDASARAAVGGVTDVATAADAITTIMNAYHLSADQAAAVSDKLFTTVRLGKTTMDELGRSIAYVAPLAATYKISIDEVLAAVAQLTKQGNSTQNAMTQISASINAVAAELGDDAFKDGLLPALEEIEKRSNGSNAALKAQLSNIRAVRGALGLTKENAEETKQMVEEIKNSAGATEAAVEKMNTLASAEITKLKNNFIKELGGLATDGMQILGGIAKALNHAFDTGNMQTFLQILGLVIAEWGVYKALTLTANAFKNAERTALLNAEYEAWMRLAPAKAINNNADVEAAIASGALTEAKGAEIIALRTELAEKIATATATKKLALEELAAAQAAVTAAEAKAVAAQEAVAAKQAELVASGEICGAYVSENAVKELSIVTDRAKIAAEEKEIAVKALASAQTKADTAATELNVLSHQKSMLAQNLEARSTANLTLGKRILTVAVQKLNAAIAANPYLVAAAALTALCVGIYKLATYESTATKQTKAMHKAVAAATQEYANEEAKLRQLNDTLKQSKKGSEEWQRAKDAILKQYGKYHSGLQTEIDKVGYLKDSYDELTKSIKRSILARQMQTYAEENMPDVSDLIGEILNSYSNEPTIPNWEAGGSKFVSLVTTPQQRQQFAEKLTKFVMGEDVQFSPAQTSFLNWKGGLLEHNLYYNQLRKARGEMKTYQDNAAILQQVWGDIGFGLPEDEDNGLTKDDNGNVIQNKAYWEKQRDDAQSALDAMQATELTTQRALDLKKKITQANAQIAKYDTKSKKGGGGGSGKTQAELNAEYAQSQQEEANLLAEQARERARQQQDAQFALEQSTIDAMEDGAAKRLRQRQLDYEKEKAEIQREMEDAILTEIEYQRAVFDAGEEVAERQAAANGNKHYARRTFNPGNLMNTHDAEGNGLIDPNKLLSEATIGNVNTAAINEILQRYQQLFADMETIHNNTWRNAQTDAMNEYLAQWGKGLEKRNAMIAVAERAMQKAETEGERRSIFAQLQKDLADFDADANRKISALGMLFDDMTDKTVKDLRKIYDKGSEALSFLIKGEWDDDKGAELGMSKETFETLRNSPEELDRIRKALRDLKRELDDVDNGFQKMARGLKDIFKSGNDPKKFKEALSSVMEGMQEVMQVAGFLSDSIGALGEAFGDDTLAGIAEGINVATDAMQGAMSGAQAGAMFGPWGAAAGAAIGLVSSLASSISKLIDKKHEKKIEELQDQIDVLEEGYDRLGTQIEKAYSKDAKNLIEQQNELLKQQKILIQQQINEEKDKKNSDDQRIKDWEKQIRDIDEQIAENKDKAIDAIFGEDIQSAINNFADAYESMFDGGINRAKASKDLVKEMIKQMIIEAMKSDISAPMEKLREMMLQFWEDGYISQWEQDQLNQFAEGIMADLESQYGWADGYFKDSTSQNSSKGGFTTMSQDTADELNGRFTALQMSNELIRVNTDELNEWLKAIATRNAANAGAIDEMRGLMLIVVDHLETIRKHTANLAEMNDRLGKIEKYTSRL